MSMTTTQPKTATARTTTIRIVAPFDVTLLKNSYRLVRYVLPDAFTYSGEKDKYARLHNELKEQLDVAYRVYTYDQMDTGRRWAVYAMYPQTTQESPIAQVRFDDEFLPAREIAFNDPKLELHILVKLLQTAYFRREDNLIKHRFVGPDKCYVYAKRRSDKSDRYHVCLEIELKGDKRDTSVFSVYGRARTFAQDDRRDPRFIHRNTYYSLIDIRDDLVMFRQVKPSRIAETYPLYVQRAFPDSRTTLDYHSSRGDEIEQSRGYLVDTFIRGFSRYLTNFGFEVEHVSREFTKFEEGVTSTFELPVDLLKKVCVLDARFEKSYPLALYLDPFKAAFPALEFKVVDHIDPDHEFPILVIEDCQAKAFEEGMPLYGRTDPHRQFYEQVPSIPKQFINVNENDVYEGADSDGYLNYEAVEPDKRAVSVALYQLFLKDVLLCERAAGGRIPVTQGVFVFIHRENRQHGDQTHEYEVALFFENDTVRFLNLRALEDREKFYTMAEQFSVEVEFDRLRKEHDKQDQDRKSYDAIVGPGLCMEIVEANESLLYEYEEIIRRIESTRTPLDLDDFKLAHRYDDLVNAPSLSYEWLLMRGYIQTPPLDKPRKQDAKDALELYWALHRFDEYLKQLKNRYAAISFRELTTNDELEAPIADIFGSIRRLHNLYKKLEMFAGPREAEVIPVYQGIWHTKDFRYVIGDTNAMNDTQPRAHRVRQVVIYRGAPDMKLILDWMSVQFVRLNQYTVRPFQFHLIDMYIDNVLRYAGLP